MTADQLQELIRKYLQTGLAVVVILVGPATATSGTNAQPQVITVTPGSSTSAASPATATGTAYPTAAAESGSPSPTQQKDKKKDKKKSTTAAPTTTTTPTTTPTTAPDTAPVDGATPGAEPDRRSGAPSAPTQAATPAGEGATAAATFGWGTPNREDDFSGDLAGWGLYDGPGHAGKGVRSPAAASVANGILTINGDAQGTTGGMAWNNGEGQKYGRWEGRVRAPASDPSYNALLLLWPDAENFPVGGEIDFMEMTDSTRQSTNFFLHYGKDNAQTHGEVAIDATQWHNWAVEWTPKGVTAYVDGKQWYHTDDTSILPPGPMHLCIQLDWFPGSRQGAVKPSQMQVDWVRQYAVDGTGAAAATAPTTAASTTAASTTRATATATPGSADTATATAGTGSGDPGSSVMRDVVRAMFRW